MPDGGKLDLGNGITGEAMIIVMDKKATERMIENVIDIIENLGAQVHKSYGVHQTIIAAVGDIQLIDTGEIGILAGVNKVAKISEPYKLAGRAFKPENTVVKIKDLLIGGDKIVVMAGPCAVESKDQIMEIAKIVKEVGGSILRGGAFKPRTSPYSFQGLGEEGLEYLHEAGKEYGLLVVTEVMDKSQIELVSKYADILQIGARNMSNFAFLKELGLIKKPILLKRGISATIKEWIMAAEYILSGGNYDVILCERGIRTYEDYTRNTLDLSAIPVIKKLSHLPVIVDPSHGTGIRDHVIPMARAAVAAGCDGLMIEMHNHPEKAKSDGAQSLYPEQIAQLMKELKIIVKAVGKKFL